MSGLQEPFDLVTNFFIVFVYCSLDFQANLEPIVTSLCTDFQEDVKFHLSLVWREILRNLLGSERFNDWGAKVRTL